MTKRKATSEVDWSKPIELSDGTPVTLADAYAPNLFVVNIPDEHPLGGDGPRDFDERGRRPVGYTLRKYSVRNILVDQAPSSGIDATLSQRGARYGSFADNARFSQRLKAMFQGASAWDKMADDQREGIEMILFKLSRIATGDPAYRDNWHDVVGYAKLVDDRMAADEAAAAA